MFFLTRICSYCHKEMGTKPTDVEPKPGYDKSHGVCDDCMKVHHPQLLEKGGEAGE